MSLVPRLLKLPMPENCQFTPTAPMCGSLYSPGASNVGSVSKRKPFASMSVVGPPIRVMTGALMITPADETFESFVIQSGDLIREGHHRCGRRRTADVTTAANCDIRVT